MAVKIAGYQLGKYKEIVRNLDLFPPPAPEPRRVDPRVLRYHQVLLEMIREGLIVIFRDEEQGGTVAFQITEKGHAARLEQAETKPLQKGATA